MRRFYRHQPRKPGKCFLLLYWQVSLRESQLTCGRFLRCSMHIYVIGIQSASNRCAGCRSLRWLARLELWHRFGFSPCLSKLLCEGWRRWISKSLCSGKRGSESLVLWIVLSARGSMSTKRTRLEPRLLQRRCHHLWDMFPWAYGTPQASR